MRRLLLLITVWVLALGLAACGDDKSSGDDSGDSELGPFDWERDPDTIIVRLDSQPDLDSQPSPENQARLLNGIPPCTVWGDGRVVWVTEDERNTEQVLKTRIDETAMRAFLEDIIFRGFYDWENEFVPPGADSPIIESITVYLYDEVWTVQKTMYWPQNAYEKILQNCRNFQNEEARIVTAGVPPEAGGWVSVYAIERDTMAPSWFWPPNAPFTLRELAENGESRWVEGDLATAIWQSAREDRGDVQVVEGDQAYKIAIVVPGISRDSLPPPTEPAPTSP